MNTKYDALEALEDKATKGLWAAPAKPGLMTTMIVDMKCQNVADVGFRISPDEDMANGRFIAAARNAVPDLIADVKALTEALEILMDWQVKNVRVWSNPAYDHAHRALARIQGEGK